MVVIVVPPGSEHRAGLGEAGEDRLVQALVPDPSLLVVRMFALVRGEHGHELIEPSVPLRPAEKRNFLDEDLLRGGLAFE